MNDEKYKTVVDKAAAHLEEAEPHIKAAMQLLCDALGIEPDDAFDRPGPEWRGDKRNAAYMLRNVAQAHLHVTDYFGS